MTSIGATFGINTYSFTQTMRASECLHYLADQGVREVEQMLFPGHLWVSDEGAELAAVRRALDDTGIRLTSVNTSNVELNITAASAEMREVSLGLNERFIAMAAVLGAPALILGPGKANPLFPLSREVLEGHFFSSLDRLMAVALDHGIEIYLENMPFAFVPDAKGMMDLLARYGEDRLKICYDVTNGWFIGEDPVEGLRTVAPRLGLMHLSDTTRATYKHDPIGAGDMDFSAFPQVLSECGYQKSCVLEVISRTPNVDFPASVDQLKHLGY
ncbi:sugar phosphate isomerase/epimerase family protein [Roseibium sp.]|uniref:sugar phosphate isomerase/epimerase family protein n=1 Tax=Roseibium sp. TaxID=1936156 RepID=UPI003A979341